MSGFEIVGIVLAAIPIVVTVLDSYGKAWGKIDGLLHHTKELQTFQRKLKTECLIFRKTCDNLLGSVWLEDDRAWGAGKIKDALEDALDPATLECFLENMNAMNILIKQLENRFPPDKKSYKTRRSKIKKTFELTMLETLHTTTFLEIKYINKRLETVLKGGSIPKSKVISSYPVSKALELFRLVRHHATVVYEVVEHNIERSGADCNCMPPHDAVLQLNPGNLNSLGSRRAPIRFRTFVSTKSTSGVRWHGMDIEPDDDLEDADTDKLDRLTAAVTPSTISSGKSLNVPGKGSLVTTRPRSPVREVFDKTFRKNLRKSARFLEPTQVPVDGAAPDTQSQPSVSFNTNFGGRWHTSITSGAAASSQSSIPVINMLCKLIPMTQSSGQFSALTAFLESSNITPARRHRLFSVTKIHPSQNVCASVTRTVTIYEIYRRNIKITLKQKLKIAICLASSVLQLYTSGWMEENWTGDDIKFLEGPDGTILLDYPLTAGRLQKPKTRNTLSGGSRESPLLLSTFAAKTIFSLGIVLIELQHQQSLETISDCGPLSETAARTTRAQPQGMSLYDRFSKAYTLCEELQSDDDVVVGYRNAVWRSIHGFDRGERGRMEDENYRRDVYKMILCPLKDALSQAFPE